MRFSQKLTEAHKSQFCYFLAEKISDFDFVRDFFCLSTNENWVQNKQATFYTFTKYIKKICLKLRMLILKNHMNLQCFRICLEVIKCNIPENSN